jgi:iron(III) transport system ATP-binding protein
MISLRDVARAHDGVPALLPTDLSLTQGSRTALMGPSGSGKTTLLRLIAGLDRPDRGQLRLDGVLVSDSDILIPPHGRGVGMVLDRPALWPHLGSWRNVTFGMEAPTSTGARARAMELLACLELTDLATRRPHALSSGEAQRVALARALAPRPSILLLDEPFSNLDARCTDLAVERVALEAERAGSTVLLVTHDRSAAQTLCTDVVTMRGGALTVHESWDEVQR